MNCDSEWWNNDLAKDIHDTLKMKVRFLYRFTVIQFDLYLMNIEIS